MTNCFYFSGVWLTSNSHHLSQYLLYFDIQHCEVKMLVAGGFWLLLMFLFTFVVLFSVLSVSPIFRRQNESFSIFSPLCQCALYFVCSNFVFSFILLSFFLFFILTYTKFENFLIAIASH